jgi:hypothetical protein
MRPLAAPERERVESIAFRPDLRGTVDALYLDALRQHDANELLAILKWPIAEKVIRTS